MNQRATLSVGLSQNFAECEKRKRFMPWLEDYCPRENTPLAPRPHDNAKNALQHINELEALIPIEKHATLSNIANDMRNHLAEIRPNQTDDFNKGYQTAINMVIDAYEDHDANTQAATSIAEIQAATLLSVAEEIRSQDDHATVVLFAKAINDGCC